MLKSLNRQIWVLILIFFILVVVSRLATYATIQAEEQDDLVIKVAAYERTLVEKMAWLASVRGPQADLDASIQVFDQNLRALRDGGQAVYSAGYSASLPPAPDAASRQSLDRISADWSTFRSELEPADSAELQRSTPLLDQELQSISAALEQRALNRIYPTEFIHEVAFGLAVVLLAVSYWLARRRIVQPLATLAAVARRIGAGDLDAPVPPMASDDIGELGRAMEATREQLAAARDELEARVAQRTADLESAFEFLQEIVIQLDLKQLLQDVTERVCNLTRADAATVSLFFEGEAKPSVVTTAGDNRKRPPDCQLMGQEQTGRTIRAGQIGIVEADNWVNQSPSPCGSGQCLAVPLRAGDVIFGSICVVRQEGVGFDQYETRALALLADAAAIAIANTRLKEREQFQAQQAAVLTERERMAGELHDNLAQTLGFLNLKMDRLNDLIDEGKKAQAAKEVEQCRAAIGIAYGQVRAALVGLHEPLPAPGKAQSDSSQEFAQKLAGYLEDFRRDTGAEAELVMQESIAQTLAPLTQTQVLHIIREALANIRRHAHAKCVKVFGERNGSQVRFIVEDDGQGFDPETIERGNHLGLTIMRARARRSGGSLAVSSAFGEGTRITACFPLDESMERTA